MCRNITVSHNSIYNTPRAGINISEGTWGGHIIEYNDIFNTVKETGDHGTINSWGRDRQTVCKYVIIYLSAPTTHTYRFIFGHYNVT